MNFPEQKRSIERIFDRKENPDPFAGYRRRFDRVVGGGAEDGLAGLRRQRNDGFGRSDLLDDDPFKDLPARADVGINLIIFWSLFSHR